MASPAADYCTQSGGVVETRYPYYGTNQNNPLQLAGFLDVCTFTADDGSHITLSLDTLYTDQPTPAAFAYRARRPFESDGPPPAGAGAWKTGPTSYRCVSFPICQLSTRGGMTYYADGTIRGADLTDLLRYSE